jgi:hypothetical protein
MSARATIEADVSDGMELVGAEDARLVARDTIERDVDAS